MPERYAGQAGEINMAVIEWDNFAVLDTWEVTGTKLKDRLYPENQPRAANALPVGTCARQIYCLTV